MAQREGSNNGDNGKMSRSEAGKRGGDKRAEQLGPEGMSELGRKGGQSRGFENDQDSDSGER